MENAHKQAFERDWFFAVRYKPAPQFNRYLMNWMINIIGVILIILGFLIPFFIHEYIFSIWFFWLGFLFVFNPGFYIKQSMKWPRWARICVLCNALITLIAVVYFNLPIIFNTTKRTYNITVYMIMDWVSSPIESLFRLFIPYPHVTKPDGAIVTH